MTMAVLFDFGGTLDADGVPWKVRFLRLCRDEGVITSPERFDRAVYAVDDALVGTVPPTLPFEDTVHELARGLTRALGVDDATIGARIARRFLDDARQSLARNAPYLERLCRRYRLGIV